MWNYHVAATDTTFSSDGHDGWLTDSNGNIIYYSKDADEWIFLIGGSEGHKYYYFPQFSWGWDSTVWYLWNDYHDTWVSAATD